MFNLKVKNILVLYLLCIFNTIYAVEIADYSSMEQNEYESDSNNISARLDKIEHILFKDNKLYLQEQMNFLQNEVQNLRGIVEKQQYLIEKMQEKILQANSNTHSKNSSIATNNYVNSLGKLTNNKDYDDYLQLYNLIKDKEYKSFLTKAKVFITTYKNSKYLPNIYYWIGYVNLLNSKYSEALINFHYLLQNFPMNDRVLDANLKIGVIYIYQKKYKDSLQIFEKILKENPHTNIGKFAQRKINQIHNIID